MLSAPSSGPLSSKTVVLQLAVMTFSLLITQTPQADYEMATSRVLLPNQKLWSCCLLSCLSGDRKTKKILQHMAVLCLPGSSAVKNPPAMQELWVQSLSQGDSLEKEITTRSNILAWEIPWTEEPNGLQPVGSKESDMT